jgi:hypothetical protein
MPLELWRKHNDQVFRDFLPELAAHLKRPEDEVRKSGIAQTEFPYQWVRVYYGDDRAHPDSVCDFGFAFPIISRRKEAVAVFAQHAGYFVFNHQCIVALRSDRSARDEKVVWGPENWWQEK